MVKYLPEFEFFYCILENGNFISRIKRSKVTDYAALNILYYIVTNNSDGTGSPISHIICNDL